MEPKLDFVFTSPVDKPITLGHEGLVMGTLKNKGLIAQVDQALLDHPQQSLSNGEMLVINLKSSNRIKSIWFVS